MSNNIMKISASNYSKLLENIQKDTTFIAEINGESINNMDDYLSSVWKAFHFPETGHINYYAYLDWIRDLDWLNAYAYIFAISNFDKFMKNAPKEREIVIKSLENIVIPWWKSEIEQFQVGGKIKAFNIYFIE